MAEEARSIRVMLCDDHEIVREGLATLVERAGMVVAGEARGAEEAVRVAKLCRPDVVVMDVRLPDGSGVEACREIRAQEGAPKVVMLTSYADDDALFAAILAGAEAYLLKQTRGQQVVDTIIDVYEGRARLDPALTARVLERIRQVGAAPDPKLAALDEQERRIVGLIAEGLTNREIGTRLSLSEKTVKNYLTAILDKLGMRRRGEVAAYVTRTGQRSDERG